MATTTTIKEKNECMHNYIAINKSVQNICLRQGKRKLGEGQCN